MNPTTARAALDEEPSTRANCDRCGRQDAPVYLEPADLWGERPAAAYCRPCVEWIANGTAPRKSTAAPSLSLNL